MKIYELWSKLLEGGYIGDDIAEYYDYKVLTFSDYSSKAGYERTNRVS